MPPRVVVDPRFGLRLRHLRRQRGLSLRALATVTYLGKSTLDDYESGRRRPSSERAAQLDQALAAGGELAALVTEDTALAYALEHPRRLDLAAIDQLAGQLAVARLAEDQLGPASMVPSATARLAVVNDLAREARGPLRPALVTVAAQWAQWAGWLHLAVRHHRRADLWLARALEWAIEADDREMVATALSFRGHRAWSLGEIGPMIGLTEAALRYRAVYVGQRAYDRYQLARGHSVAGDRRAAVEALAAGADLADETVADLGPRPPWHYYRSRAFFDLEHGLVRSLLGERSRARELVAAGLAALPPEIRAAEWTAMYRAAVSAPF